MTHTPDRPVKALVVDDEADLATLVADYLKRDGLDVRIANNGEAAVGIAREFDPDVITLDLNLPRLGGVEVCRQIRLFSDCHIIMLTARADEVDVLVGLSVGADDYMTKPFRPRELVARVTAIMRRPRLSQITKVAPPERHLSIGGLKLNLDSREVTLDGEPVDVTRTEFDIMAILAEYPNRVFTRNTLVEAVWGSRLESDERLADAHIVHLRQKLGDSADSQRYIRTVRGVGYRAGKG
jgi:DNA-binding response OmpR family regulator